MKFWRRRQIGYLSVAASLEFIKIYEFKRGCNNTIPIIVKEGKMVVIKRKIITAVSEDKRFFYDEGFVFTLWGGRDEAGEEEFRKDVERRKD